MTAATSHRLAGLESDNLLAFLALLGLLRALETRGRRHSEGDKFQPRAYWDIDHPPLRPILHLSSAVTQDEVADGAAEGLEILALSHDFQGQADLNYSREHARILLREEAEAASQSVRSRAD